MLVKYVKDVEGFIMKDTAKSREVTRPLDFRTVTAVAVQTESVTTTTRHLPSAKGALSEQRSLM